MTFFRVALVIALLVPLSGRADDLLELKRTQYRRILLPPQEPALDSAKLLRFVEDPKTDLKAMRTFEQVMDCRASLYAVCDRLNHRFQDDLVVRRMLKSGYQAVNNLDLTGAAAVAKALAKRFAAAEADYPLTDLSPYSWLKNFTQWGYVRHPDGMSLYEPDPWNLTWQDGFEMNVAQDPRVSTARCAASEPRYRETRFLSVMSDVSVERRWTSTRWNLPDRRVTFSVLTPVVDIDGVETLTLSGFPSAPDKLAWITCNGQWRGLKLTDGADFEPQVVASAIQDFNEAPPPPPTRAKGVQSVNPKDVDRPWLLLTSQGKWDLILLPGARPISAGWENGVFSIRFPRKTYVGILKAPGNLHSHELPQLAEFFAGVAAAYPRVCREKVKGEAVGWRYDFERRPNDWQMKPHEIAPVPPLADFAGMRVRDLRRFRYPTKWNLLAYVEGDTARGLPPQVVPEVLRGVNVGLFQSGELSEHIKAGANWVRLVLHDKKSLAENLKEVEKVLANSSFSATRFLIDPHGLDYFIGWGGGIPGAEGEKKCLEMWEAIAKLCARHPDRIAGYDLYNEPGVVDGSEGRWREVATRITQTIRRYDSKGRIYFSGVYGGNANGLFNLMPIADEPAQSLTFHFYSPHSFTHQKCQTHKDNDPFVWYPGWAPDVDWTRRIHYGGSNVEWYDRWSLAALMLPALEASAQWHLPLHCGEFSVVGYANAVASRSAFIWTRDVTELLEHAGISWNIWNWGFGMCNPDVADYMHRCWNVR